MTTATDVYESVRDRIGVMARRRDQSVPTPTEADHDLLKRYLSDGLSELGSRTDRLTDNVVIETAAGQAFLPRPPHIYTLDEATVQDGGTAYELDVTDGQEVAKRARQPDPARRRPQEIGAYAGKLWFWQVPDDTYTVDLQVQLSGEYSESTPVADDEPPTLDQYVTQVPKELDRALVAFVTSEWLDDLSQVELANKAFQWFESRLAKHQDEPIQQSTATRPYNPLSL